MFNKKFKLICTAIGLVAVLVMGLVVPGATQQNPLTRPAFTQAVKDTLGAMLTAAEGDILSPEAATVVSLPFVTVTYVPISRESRSAQRLIDELFSGRDFDPIFLGVIFVDQHPNQYYAFPKGAYQVFLTSSGVLQLVDQEGNVTPIPGKIPEIKLTNKDRDLLAQVWAWGLSFETSLTNLLLQPMPQQKACDKVLASSALLECTQGKTCNSFKFLGITIWESCQDVLVCKDEKGNTIIIKG